jgi:hypothetical protein
MRKLIISLAAAASALAIATPAAAQYYPGQPAYGYGYGHNSRAQLRNELQQIRFQADNLARQGRLTRYEARDLFRDIASAERALYRSNNPWQTQQLHRKVAHIRYELHRYSDYDGRRGYGNGYGYNNQQWIDRDRDGRNDRHEDDRGWQRDR